MHVPVETLKSGDRWEVVRQAESVPCRDQWYRRPFYQSQAVGSAHLHANCACTESASINRRVFVEQPSPPARVLRYQRQVVTRLKRMVRAWGLEPLSEEEFVARAPSRTLYERSLTRLKLEGRQKSMTWVKMFVKADKLDNKKTFPAKPRAIQSRDPCFNIVFGRYVEPIATRMRSQRGVHGGQVRSFAKGRNARGRATDIRRKLERFPRCRVYVIDATSFDASVSQRHLGLVHSVYRAGYGEQEDLEWCMRAQLVNTVFTSAGSKYVIKGNRMSGDMDTGSGNDLISYINAYVACKILGVSRYEVYIDGDDMLLFVDDEGSPSNDQMRSAFFEAGFIVSPDSVWPADDPSKICFGRSRYGFDDDGPVLFRNPHRALACFGVNHKYPSDKVYYQVLKGVAHGEAVISRGVPMLGPLAYAVYGALGCGERYDFEYHKRRDYMRAIRSPVRPPRVSYKARLSVEQSFGVAVEQQLYFESMIPDLVQGLRRQWDRPPARDGPTDRWEDFEHVDPMWA